MARREHRALDYEDIGPRGLHQLSTLLGPSGHRRDRTWDTGGLDRLDALGDQLWLDLHGLLSEVQDRFAAGEEVLRPLAAEALAGPDVEAFAVGGEPDRDVVWVAGLAAVGGEGDLALVGGGLEHFVGEIGHIKMNRRGRLAHSRSGPFTGWVGESACWGHDLLDASGCPRPT